MFTYDGEVYFTKVGNKGVEKVTVGPGYARRPEWSPNGKTILFCRIIPNVSRYLYYLDVATHEVTPVFPAPKNNNPNKKPLQ